MTHLLRKPRLSLLLATVVALSGAAPSHAVAGQASVEATRTVGAGGVVHLVSHASKTVDQGGPVIYTWDVDLTWHVARFTSGSGELEAAVSVSGSYRYTETATNGPCAGPSIKIHAWKGTTPFQKTARHHVYVLVPDPHRLSPDPKAYSISTTAAVRATITETAQDCSRVSFPQQVEIGALADHIGPATVHGRVLSLSRTLQPMRPGVDASNAWFAPDGFAPIYPGPAHLTYSLRLS
jgi:hypothetical protein